MQSVKILNPNFNAATNGKKPVKQPSFGLNAGEAAKKVEHGINDLFKRLAEESTYAQRKAAKEELKKGLKGVKNFFYYLGKTAGEKQSTIVNAVGTALVAPIFIAYNPISKEDKETRIYSAWRQPISAVLAVATQVGINIPFDKYINKLAANGKLGEKYDLSAKPDVNYLLKQAKKQGINITNNKDMVDEYIDKIHPKKFQQAVEEKIKTILKDPKKYEPIYKKVKGATDPKKIEHFGELIAKEAKEMVKNHISQAENRVKGLKTKLGLGLSLLTLPPTCSLLNWSYPRFMEILFPEKCKSQKLKGGK